MGVGVLQVGSLAQSRAAETLPLAMALQKTSQSCVSQTGQWCGSQTRACLLRRQVRVALSVVERQLVLACSLLGSVPRGYQRWQAESQSSETREQTSALTAELRPRVAQTRQWTRQLW